MNQPDEAATVVVFMTMVGVMTVVVIMVGVIVVVRGGLAMVDMVRRHEVLAASGGVRCKDSVWVRGFALALPAGYSASRSAHRSPPPGLAPPPERPPLDSAITSSGTSGLRVPSGRAGAICPSFQVETSGLSSVGEVAAPSPSSVSN